MVGRHQVSTQSEWPCAEKNCDRQVEKLWRCASRTDPGYDSRHLPIRQQSSRALASANTSEGARHASLQIDKSGPTVSVHTRRGVQPVQFGSTLGVGQSLSAIQTTRLCVLELRNGLITESTWGGLSCSDINLSIPLRNLRRSNC